MNRHSMRSPSHLAGILLLTGILTTGGVLAAPPATPMGNQAGSDPFSIHDLDRDGLLSREEYQQFLTKIELQHKAAEQSGRHFPPLLRFEEIDTNKDGYLNESEMVSALNRRLERQKQYRRRGRRWE